MMKRDPRHIHELMTSWLTGNISEEEYMYLKRLVAEDPEVRADWTRFLEKFSPEDIQNAFSRYEALDWIPAGDITRDVPSRNRLYKLIRRTVQAAAVITGIGAGWYLISKSKTPEVTQPVAKVSNIQPEDKKDIALQLANGAMINLSSAKDSIVFGDARLNNAGKTLSYKLAGANAYTPEAVAMNSLRVPVGKEYKITLSDGSEVWLNSASTLQFPFKFTGKTREITISGEAYLKVAKHASQPFLVHTPHGTVQVLGTAFNVNAYDSGMVKVALVEGAVRFSAGEKNVTIKPGTEAVYMVNQGIRLQQFDEEEVLAWRSGKYYFSDATLKEITTVLPRWYGIRVIIDNPALGNERFAGMMDRNRPITAFLDNLSKTMNISYYFDKEEVLHLQ